MQSSCLALILCALLLAATSGARAQPASTNLPAPVPPPPGLFPRPDPASIEQIDQQLAAALRYPVAAKSAGEQSQSMVVFDIDRDGRILEAHLAQDSGSAPIDAEVMDVFKRIGAFQVKMPASYVPVQNRFSLNIGIGFYLFHESQRDTATPPGTPDGAVRPVTVPISAGWRTGIVAAIAGNIQQPADLPEQYKLILHLKLDESGKPREASVVQSSGVTTVDAALLDAARRASLPSADSPALAASEIQLCLAAPDNACTQHESLRTVGTALVVRAFVPDNTLIVRRASRFLTYLQRVQQTISDNVQYPKDARRRGEQGTVIARITMQRDGTITEVELLRQTPYPLLNAAAHAAFEHIAHFPSVPDDVKPEEKTFKFELPIEFSLH